MGGPGLQKGTHLALASSQGLSSRERPALLVFTPLDPRSSEGRLVGHQVSSGCPHVCASRVLAAQGRAQAEGEQRPPWVRPRALPPVQPSRSKEPPPHPHPSKLSVLQGGAL